MREKAGKRLCFFQAEDGIRDVAVTGVQTCALPICQNGVKAAYNKVHAKLDTLTNLGYSCAGEIISVGEGVHEFRPGDRVACGGGSYANHAEINFVPRNLAVHIPSQVSTLAASLTTIGAIALQEIGRASCRERV